jgi:hypothetical protein
MAVQVIMFEILSAPGVACTLFKGVIKGIMQGDVSERHAIKMGQ